MGLMVLPGVRSIVRKRAHSRLLTTTVYRGSETIHCGVGSIGRIADATEHAPKRGF